PQGPQIMQFFDQMLGQLAMPGVGDVMDIKFTSTAGEEIDLTAMKDKVILVDFWATWCGPCVAEMPHVIGTYKKYKEAGFEVIGISLDSDKAALDEFVAEYEMAWPQYFDGKGWDNDLAKEFGIKGIPATFLIGKDGKIVASNLRGNALEEAVAGLLE
ncbi:MAG: TlpA disulfide reductase family protein, partial [Verrucomicrobiota bacterium]